MKYTIFRGALDPYALRVIIDATGIALADRVIEDLTDVTAIEFRTRDKRSGALETWTTTIVSATADVLTADHPLLEADTATLRELHVVPWVTASGAANAIPIEGFDLQVVEP